MDKLFNGLDTRTITKFEKSLNEILSIYLLNSATEQGLLDEKVRDYIIRSI